MADSPIQQKYTVRPLSKPPRNDLKDSFKVFVSSNALYAHLKMKPGDVCTVRISSAVGTKPRRHSAIIWNAIERIQDSIIQTSIVLQELYGLKLGDKVIIEPKDSPLLDAQQIKLRDVSEAIDLGIADSALESENNHWAWFMRGVLERAEILCTGMALGPVEINGRSRSFRVDGLRSIGAGPSQLSEDLCRYSGKSSVDIASSAHGSDTRLPVPKLQISAMGIGGLSVQITRLNSFLSALCDEYEDLQIPSFKRRRFGLLIYGASGTGKSLLLEKITSAGWGKVFHLGLSVLGISGVEDEAAAIRKVFSNAKLEDRSIIVIDNIDYIASKVEAGSSGAVRALISELDQLRKAPAQSGYRSYARVLVVGSTNRLAIIDPELRKPGRLGTELEIPIPDAKSRIEILKVIQGISPNDEDEMSEYIGSRAHGYVGADLEELLQVTAEIALSRHRNMNHTHVQRTGTFGEKLAIKAEPQLLSKQALTLTLEDASQAFLEVPPTAMKEVVLEPPKIKWADIGGQENVKKKLQQAVEWPLKYPTLMKWAGVKPRKGILLYGPPGCSKTMTAQALASEAGLNFMAVKGAELLSMYVGESERAVRELFRRARNARPSIIFLDEIDSIGSGTKGPSQNNGLNVVTTLLNELDGIEVLEGVTVVAATNKPESLDAALLRPGRFDTILYVGPPDLSACKEILKIRTSKMAIADDLNIDELAQNLYGYSGAEIADICDKAGYAAIEEFLKYGHKAPINRSHFEIALGEVERQITTAMKTKYENWSVASDKWSL